MWHEHFSTQQVLNHCPSTHPTITITHRANHCHAAAALLIVRHCLSPRRCVHEALLCVEPVASPHPPCSRRNDHRLCLAHLPPAAALQPCPAQPHLQHPRQRQSLSWSSAWLLHVPIKRNKYVQSKQSTCDAECTPSYPLSPLFSPLSFPTPFPSLLPPE